MGLVVPLEVVKISDNVQGLAQPLGYSVWGGSPYLAEGSLHSPLSISASLLPPSQTLAVASWVFWSSFACQDVILVCHQYFCLWHVPGEVGASGQK